MDPSQILTIAGIVAFCIIVLISATITTISAGHVGVVKRFGAVQNKQLEEGLNFVTPFVNTVAEIDTRLSTAQ